LSSAGKKNSERDYGFLTPILTVMIVALVLSFFGLVFQLSANVSSPGAGYGNSLLIVNVAVFGTGALVALLLFYFLLRESVNIAVRLSVSLFVFTAIMSSLIYVRLFLGSYGFSSPIALILLSIVAYMGSFLGVLATFDALSKNARNLLFAACSGILGAFIGVIIPPLAMIIMIGLLAVLDIVTISRQTVRQSQKVLQDYESLVVLKLSYAGRDWAIGIGDLVSYSILVANSLANFGLTAALSSLALILAGSIINSRLAQRRQQVSGLPIATGLGLIPVIFCLILLR
jgi:hypothetical protein